MKRRDQVRADASDYAGFGWGVIPGSVWDGSRFTQGHMNIPTPGLIPIMLSGRTLREPQEVWSWWSVAPYAVLTRVGEDFDVLTAPISLVRATLELDDSIISSCPIIVTPAKEQARLLVRTGSRLRWELRALSGVSYIPGGTLMPLPPTIEAGGAHEWWVSPSKCSYMPGKAGAVQAALASAVGLAPGRRW